MDHRIGVGIIWVDAEGPRKPRSIIRLDRREPKSPCRIAFRDKTYPARAEDADAVEQDHVVVGPFAHQRLSSFNSATGISTMAGPVFICAPSIGERGACRY